MREKNPPWLCRLRCVRDDGKPKNVTGRVKGGVRKTKQAYVITHRTQELTSRQLPRSIYRNKAEGMVCDLQYMDMEPSFYD